MRRARVKLHSDRIALCPRLTQHCPESAPCCPTYAFSSWEKRAWSRHPAPPAFPSLEALLSFTSQESEGICGVWLLETIEIWKGGRGLQQRELEPWLTEFLRTAGNKQKLQPVALLICRTKMVAPSDQDIQCSVLPDLGLQIASPVSLGYCFAILHGQGN